MSFWVHLETDPRTSWVAASEFAPPLPKPEPGKGWAHYFVEVEDCTLEFASIAELAECVRVLSLKPLPTTRQLSALRPGGAGPNSHWLSRLPAHLKSGPRAARVVAYLRECLDELSRDVEGAS